MRSASLQLDYVGSDELANLSAEWWRDVLGVVGFAKPPMIEPASAPVTASRTPALRVHDRSCEVWRLVGPRNGGFPGGSVKRGRVDYRVGDDFLFGSVSIDESALPGGGAAALLHATETAYREIFELLEETGLRHLVRVWNTLPEITGEADGEERYRHFNAARQAAFLKCGRSTVGTVPAASALGSPAGSPISIYFLASRLAPTLIENPRQTSAYHYPPKFGPHSPTFSRACVMHECSGTNLFVSGTASIVGHETMHPGDVLAQTREALANIDALIREANRVAGERYSLDELKLKVYVRRPHDLDGIEHALSTLCAASPILYVQADVCREDLLGEIEATGRSTRN